MKKVIHVSLGVGILAAFLAICFFVFHIPEFYPQVLAIIASAFLGAGITAWITNTLLDNQQKSEEEKEKNIKIYEEKLKIYSDFLRCLYEVIKDKKVSEEEAIRLQFQTSYITMHTESTHIKNIAKKVKIIVENIGEDNGNNLMECLFSIVEEFRQELYQTKKDDKTERDSSNIEYAISEFSAIMDAVKVQQINNDGNDTPINLAQNFKVFVEELRNRIEQHLGKWTFDLGNIENGVNINIGKMGQEEEICVMLRYDNKGEYYFQVHLERNDSLEIYEKMKRAFGGRRNKWCWWKYLDVNWRFLANTQEIRTRNWGDLLEYMENKIVELLTFVDNLE